MGQSLRWMAACAVLVGGFEGLSTTASPDKLANGLLTVCYGETKGVKRGDHYTKQQCLEMLQKSLPPYWFEIEPNIHVQLSDNEKIAYTSFTYNLGSDRFNKSSFLKKLNAGDHVGACRGMLTYDHTRSMGQVAGLTKRRHKEDAICETIEVKGGPVTVVVPLRKPAPLKPIEPNVSTGPMKVCYPFLWFWEKCV